MNTPHDINAVKGNLYAEIFSLYPALAASVYQNNSLQYSGILPQITARLLQLGQISAQLGEAEAKAEYDNALTELQQFLATPPQAKDLMSQVGLAMQGAAVDPAKIPFLVATQAKIDQLKALLSTNPEPTPQARAIALTSSLYLHQLDGILKFAEESPLLQLAEAKAGIDKIRTDISKLITQNYNITLPPMRDKGNTPAPIPPPHPRTGIPELDNLRLSRLDAPGIQGLPYSDVAQVTLDFYIRKDDNDVFHLSPVTKPGAPKSDTQEILAVVDTIGGMSLKEVEGITKCANTVVSLSLAKRVVDGKPIYVIRPGIVPDFDTSDKISTFNPDTSEGMKPMDFSYGKHTNKALNKHGRLAGDILAQKLILEMRRLSATDMTKLLEAAGTLETLNNSIRNSNLGTIDALGCRDWTKKTLFEEAGINPDTNPQQIADFVDRHLKGKTFAQLAECKLPQAITYIDESGQPKTITSLGQNLYRADYEQGLPPALLEELKKNPESLLAFAAHRAVFRSLTDHLMEKRYKVTNATTGKEVDFITDSDIALAEKGILFKPQNPDDPIVPYHKKGDVDRLAKEVLQQELELGLTNQVVLAGAEVFNKADLVDDVAEKAGLEGLGAEQSVQARLDYLEHTALPASTSDIKSKVSQDRIKSGLPAIGEMNNKEAKAAWAAFLAILGPLFKGIEEFKVMESNLGII